MLSMGMNLGYLTATAIFFTLFCIALYFQVRSPGDQPGRGTPRYLSDWKSLPEGIFIPTNKYEFVPFVEAWKQKDPTNRPMAHLAVPFPTAKSTNQILPVIALCYYAPPGSVLLLEQPEIHLHPRVQAGLADVLIDAVKTRGIQVIVESHSEHLLRRLQRNIAEEKVSSQETALYFCEIEAGVSRLTELQVDMYGNIENWPDGFFGDEFEEIAAMQKAILRRRGGLAK